MVENCGVNGSQFRKAEFMLTEAYESKFHQERTPDSHLLATRILHPFWSTEHNVAVYRTGEGA
jgi:hypothetical protein